MMCFVGIKAQTVDTKIAVNSQTDDNPSILYTLTVEPLKKTQVILSWCNHNHLKSLATGSALWTELIIRAVEHKPTI